MKKKRIFIAIILAIVIITGVIVYACYSNNSKKGKFLVSKETYDISKVSKLDLNGTVGNYNIKIVKSGECTIEEYANIQLDNGQKIEGKVDNDTFIISNPLDSKDDVTGLRELNFNICIPESIIKEYNILLDVGNLNISSDNDIVDLKDLKIYSEVGDVSINSNIKSDNIQIYDAIGNVITKDLNGSLVNVTNGTGNITINNLLFEKSSKIETNIGDIKLRTSSEYFIDAKTNTGSVELDKNLKAKESKNSKNLILKTDIGNIIVENKK